MSGGQQAQLALTLALARQPRLLVLDEPLAMLDPLARFDFMDTVMTAASADGLSVVLSSHVLAELERVANYLIVLSQGQLQWPGRSTSSAGTGCGRPGRGRRGAGGPAAGSARRAERRRVPDAGRCCRPGQSAAGRVAGRQPSLEKTALAYLRGPAEPAVPATVAPAGPAEVTA